MIKFDPLLLARIQFAFTVSFHIIFPAFTIGLASFLAVLEWRWLKTQDEKFKEIYQFWVKIFAVAFGMGVVSGVVMSYQFGTNWAVFADNISNVLGPLLGFEVLTAFFLEASFLGIMLFGWGKVSPRMHFTATSIVAIGTLISAFWILSANSWMQTPQGFAIGPDGRFEPLSWLKIIFNPSFPYRFVHMITAAYLTTAFVVGGISSLYLLQGRYQAHSKIMLSMATLMAAVVAPFQLIVGDFHGLNTLQHQPAKVAAMEGLWETTKGADLLLFALPNQKDENNSYELRVPKLASLILTHDINGEVKGLKEWPKDQRPPVMPVFWSFRVMVGLGFMMIGVGLWSAIEFFRKKLFINRYIQYVWVMMTPSGFIALLAGWFVTEIGRQPYTVYGFLTTKQSVSPSILGPQVAWSLGLFIVVYSFIFGAAIYYISGLIKKGLVISKDREQFYAHGLESAIILGE